MLAGRSRNESPTLKSLCLLPCVAFLLAANGQSLDWKGLPEAYAGATELQSDQFKEASIVLSGDILTAFPELAGRCSSALERKVFMQSAEADSFRELLRSRRAGFLKTPYVVRLCDTLPEFDVEAQAFVLEIGSEQLLGCKLPCDAPDEEVGALKRYLRHTVRRWTPAGADEEQEAAHGRATDLWFDELPPLSVEVFLNTFQQRLRLNVRDDQQALMLEHRRREVSVWLGFELTGEMQKTSKGWDAYSAAIWGGTWVSLKAESPVVFLVDTSGEVLLHRRYE